MGGSWGGAVKRCFTRGRIAERWSDAVLPQVLGAEAFRCAKAFRQADALDKLTERTRSPRRELRAWESGDRGWVLDIGNVGCRSR